MLHYGMNNEEVLKKLYDKKKDQLKSRGIDISFEDLLQYYR